MKKAQIIWNIRIRDISNKKTKEIVKSKFFGTVKRKNKKATVFFHKKLLVNKTHIKMEEKIDKMTIEIVINILLLLFKILLRRVLQSLAL